MALTAPQNSNNVVVGLAKEATYGTDGGVARYVKIQSTETTTEKNLNESHTTLNIQSVGTTESQTTAVSMSRDLIAYMGDIILGLTDGDTYYSAATDGEVSPQYTHRFFVPPKGVRLCSQTFAEARLDPAQSGTTYSLLKALGCKLNTLNIKKSGNGPLNVTANWIGMEPETAVNQSLTFTIGTTLPAANDRPFQFPVSVFYYSDYDKSAEATDEAHILDYDITFNNNLQQDWGTADALTQKTGSIYNAYRGEVDVSGSFVIYWNGRAAASPYNDWLYDMATAGDQSKKFKSIKLAGYGMDMGSTTKDPYSFKIVVPKIEIIKVSEPVSKGENMMSTVEWKGRAAVDGAGNSEWEPTGYTTGAHGYIELINSEIANFAD